MYCGAQLPAHQRFSDKEIAQINSQQEQTKEEEKAMLRRQSKRKTNSNQSWTDFVNENNGSDCGDGL